ncbi:DUF2142 domain-containing protein [Ectobacillus sp. JY-23]|uniref:DUF2142 domain-containing protein n=1 Tax=Ectobacillus sp. JY-23 TaxID=2933872 RepID=UPI001FF2CC7C|nr:DUF2142 domain-containing protein [Ectobacillus sp. JY-23]UOY91322.1 DUF2142 domain-containing protein [Ectobacillus sp. JY-23]
MSRFQSVLKSYWLHGLLILLTLLSFLLFMYDHRSLFLVPREMDHTVVSQNESNAIMGELGNNMLVSQSFVSPKDTFSKVQLSVGTYQRENQGVVSFQLKEAGQSQPLFETTIEIQQLKDGINSFSFPAVQNAKGKTYEFTLRSTNTLPGKSFTLWKSSKDSYADGTFTIDGINRTGDLYFQVMYVENKPLLTKQQLAFITLIFFIMFGVSSLLVLKYKHVLHKAFLAIVIPFGVVMSLIVPPFDQLDELEHYYRAFEVSEGKFINQIVDGKVGNYIPKSLVDTVTSVRYIHQDGYKYSLVKEALDIPLQSEERIFLRNYASSYPPLVYIPQSLGLILGRVLFDSPLLMLFLGRLFNFAAYTAIAYYSLKIVPVKKLFFFILAILPMSLIHASSLSADGMTNASALLFVCYMLYLAYGKPDAIRTKHMIISSAIGIFIALSKIVYIPIIFMFLIIPLAKFKNKKDYLQKFVLVLIGCLIPFIIWNLLNMKNMSVPDLRGYAGVSPSDQVKFVLTNPITYTKILLSSFLSQAMPYLMGILGQIATNYSYATPLFVVDSFLILLVLFGMIQTEEDAHMKLTALNKVLFAFIIIAVVVLTMTALYVGFTSVGDPVIKGVQGRYFVPIASFLFLLLSNNNLVNRNPKTSSWIVTIGNILIYTLLINYIIHVN